MWESESFIFPLLYANQSKLSSERMKHNKVILKLWIYSLVSRLSIGYMYILINGSMDQKNFAFSESMGGYGVNKLLVNKI